MREITEARRKHARINVLRMGWDCNVACVVMCSFVSCARACNCPELKIVPVQLSLNESFKVNYSYYYFLNQSFKLWVFPFESVLFGLVEVG